MPEKKNTQTEVVADKREMCALSTKLRDFNIHYYVSIVHARCVFASMHLCYRERMFPLISLPSSAQ